MLEDDVQLIQRTLSGDDSAFSTLVQKHQKCVHALIWRKVGDFHFAEELTQDTFLQVYKKLRTLKDPKCFTGWLYVIANRLTINWIQRRKPTMQSLEDTPAEEIDESSYAHYLTEQRETENTEHRSEVVKEILEKLPESERTVVTLHYLGEMTAKEIGNFLGVSVNTIKSRLRRGQERLQQTEILVREVLGSVRLPVDLTERIMREVADINPTVPPTGKPLVPLVSFGTATILIVLLLGASHQYLIRFQNPYSFEARSEPTIEITDALIVLDTVSKPTIRNQFGQIAVPGKSRGVSIQVSETTLRSNAQADSLKPSTSSQWMQGNTPPGGHVSDIFATSEGTVYAVAPTGMYRLTSEATAWTRLNASVPIGESPMPMAEYRAGLYVVSTDEIFTSDNKGETWHSLGPRPRGDAVGLIITDAAQVQGSQTPITMYLALRKKGIFRSTDGGTQWSSLKDGLTAEKISAVAAVAKTVFTGTENGLYRLDSGVWKKLPMDTSGAICSLTTFENNLYVGTGPDILVKLTPMEVMQVTERNESGSVKIFHSADFGASWTEITPENGYWYMGPPAGITVLAAGETLMALGAAQSRSTDGGQTWTKLGFDLNWATMSSLPVVAVNEKTFYKAGTFGIHRTTDGGESWHLFMNGMTGTRVNDLIVFKDKLYAHTNYEVYQSTDQGVSWKKVWIDGEDNAAPDSSFDSNLVADSNILYLLSPIKSGLRICRLSPDGNVLSPIQGIPAFDDEVLSVALWTGSEEVKGTYLPTGSGEGDRSMVRLPMTQRYARTKMAAVGNGVFYIEYRRRLLKWSLSDPGWTDTGFVDTSQLFDSDSKKGFKLAVFGETIYVGKRDGRLFQSLDGGNNWRDVTPNLPFYFTSFKEIVFVGSTVYVATDAGVLASETGEHWRGIMDQTGRPIVINRFAINHLAVTGSTVYGVGDTGIYRLHMDGRWHQFSPEVPGKIVSLGIINNKLYSATKDQGIFQISLAEDSR